MKNRKKIVKIVVYFAIAMLILMAVAPFLATLNS